MGVNYPCADQKECDSLCAHAVAGATAVPLKTAGALTTYKITQHLVKLKRQPLAMHIAEDMPAGARM